MSELAIPTKRSKKISICSPKGGTGKTSFAQQILSLAAKENFAAIGVDFDPQRTLHKWNARREATKARYPKRELVEFHVSAEELKHWPHVIEKVESYDLAIFDMLPSIDYYLSSLHSICRESDLILVTTQATYSDIDSTLPWVEMLAREKYNVAVCINRVQGAESEFLREVKKEFLKVSDLCPVSVRNMVQYHMPSMEGMTYSDMNRKNNDFATVWEFIKRKVGLEVPHV